MLEEEFSNQIKGHNNKHNYFFNDESFDFVIYIQIPTINIHFKNCIFNNKISFANKSFDRKVYFEDCTFNNEFDLTNSDFQENCRFYNCHFKEVVKFDNTKFHKLADFWKSTFYKKTIFYKTDFLGTTVFSKAHFNENVLFTYSLISERAIFSNTECKKGLDLSQALIGGTINTFNLIVSDFPIDDSGEYETQITESGNIPSVNKRETFRSLKSLNLKNHNSIDAFKYESMEQRAFQSELMSSPLLKRLNDKAIYGLNYLSNNHRKSFFQGIIFTLLVGLIFYYVAVINTETYYFQFHFDKDIFAKCLKGYFSFLLPTHKFSIYNQATSWTFFFDLFGRIFVSYGIYQTIRAFRKYSSK